MTIFVVWLEAGEIVEDFGAGPVLGGDEFAADVSLAVDDIGFRDLCGAVEGVDAAFLVADGDEVYVMLYEEALVDVGVLVDGDGYDGKLGHFFLEVKEAGELFDAGGAVGGPEVEDDDFSAEFAEVNGVGAVGHDELGGWGGDVGGVAAAVASGE